MTNENKTILVSRFKSLAWRFCMMALAILIAFAVDNLSLFPIPAEFTVLLGLVLGEVSKAIRQYSGNLPA